MLLSQLVGERYREKPADATLISHQYLLRGGYIRPVSNGSYTMLTPAKRVTHKIEAILRSEMEKLGGQEVSFPVVLPRELWEESGRYQSIGKELLRFSDRSDADYVLAMTHEEAAVHLARTDAKSYTKYPFMIYQIQTKFRDEPRARGGLIRVREFTMKDAYSFHTTQEDLNEYYNLCHESYVRIFKKAGLKNTVSIGSDTGMMGGSIAHEFMLISDSGEDHILLCDSCDYRANMEVAESKLEHFKRPQQELKKVSTPNISTIQELSEFLNAPKEQFIKAAFFFAQNISKAVLVFLRGDLEVNEAKLRKVLSSEIELLSSPEEFGICPGFCGPVNLSCDDSVLVYYDRSLEGENDLVCGANQKDMHFTGVSTGRDFSPKQYHDLSKAQGGQKCPHCDGTLQEKRGIEIGNIFQLGTKYTKSMGMTYIDQDGSAKHPIMGCYGIGVGRLLACVIEDNHDDYGPIWPYSVAPWQIHICSISNKKEDVLPIARKIYEKLSQKYEVLLDDRNLSAGVQFNDADLLGVPIRIIVGVRNLENNQVEICSRDKSIQKKVDLSSLESEVDEIADKLKSQLL